MLAAKFFEIPPRSVEDYKGHAQPGCRFRDGPQEYLHHWKDYERSRADGLGLGETLSYLAHLPIGIVVRAHLSQGELMASRGHPARLSEQRLIVIVERPKKDGDLERL